MNGFSTWRRLLLAAGGIALALGLGLGAAPHATAQDEVVAIGRTTIGVGGQVTVNLEVRGIDAPGLGAWIIGVNYDPAIVTAVSCTAQPVGSNFCNAAFSPSRVQVSGAAGAGPQGTVLLARITFRCDTLGTSALAVKIQELADATAGGPQPIAATPSHGSIGCTEVTPPSLLGDVNCDGLIDSRDAALILQLTARLISTVPCPENANVNRDGSIDSRDAALILQYDAGLISVF
jgi:hypothetical protein